jgi:hypothetical protein
VGAGRGTGAVGQVSCARQRDGESTGEVAECSTDGKKKNGSPVEKNGNQHKNIVLGSEELLG